jgi:RimJ/RimL family protein N-acetyltransferase
MQNPKNTTEPIEGSRIRLWPVSLEDARVIAGIMTADVSQWLASWPANLTVETIAERISRAHLAMQEKRELHFRIEEREQNQTVGYVSIAQSGTDRSIGHLSYWLGTAFQGKGYMTEAVRHSLVAAFQYLDVETIEAGAQLENISSIALSQDMAGRPFSLRCHRSAPHCRARKCRRKDLLRELPNCDGIVIVIPNDCCLRHCRWNEQRRHELRDHVRLQRTAGNLHH